MTIQFNPVVSSAAAEQFAARLVGKVVLPSDSEYDAARRAWNVSVDQQPALVVFPESAQDVAEAVVFAREHSLPVAVMSTGHGVVGRANGAVLINTVRMDGVRVDPRAQTARLEAGVLVPRLDQRLLDQIVRFVRVVRERYRERAQTRNRAEQVGLKTG